MSETRTVLIVEDTQVDRELLAKTLEKNSFKVIQAENGRLGLEKAREHKPDIIVLDCEMPEMSGNELCQELKDDELTEDIPVIFLTSVDTPKNMMECFDLDAENFLTKPVDPKLLMTHINTILDEFLSS